MTKTRLACITAALTALLGQDHLNATVVGMSTVPGATLRAARSLRCKFTSVALTEYKQGVKTNSNEETPKDAAVTYDSLDTVKHTGRIIGNVGAGDIQVHLDHQGALWFVEQTPAQLYVVTTVFPLYAPGTTDFIVLESRHSFMGTLVLGQQSTGTCAVLN